MGLKVWFREAVEPSLLMSFLLVSLGTAVAAREGFFNLAYYVLAIIGVTLTQNAVNVLNDYYDYKTGVDTATLKTPFSGGSKFLVSGQIRPNSALCVWLGFASACDPNRGLLRAHTGISASRFSGGGRHLSLLLLNHLR